MREEKKIYFPLFASKDLNGGNQSEEESKAVWDAIFALDADHSSRLLSNTIVEAIAGLEERYQLSERLVEYVTVTTREVFFGGMTEQQALDLLGQEMKSLPSMDSSSIIQYIQQKVFRALPDLEVVEEAEEQIKQTIISKKIQILQALSEYPNLGNQPISEERIRIKSQPEPVRGSLANWIKYYRYELGIGQHSTVERGQFLFRSENGKALSTFEREKVNLILKSLEENLPLEIDTERQEIVFPPIDVEASVPAMVPAPAVLTKSSAVEERVAPVQVPAPAPRIVELPKTEAPVRLDAKPFVPKSAPSKPVEPISVASKFQPSVSPYQKISIPPQPLSLERMTTSNPGIDVSQMAEKLKREPKPEWIKGVFTKDSIPETTPIAPAVGTMSFSFNHALPAEQEKRQTPLPIIEPNPEPPTPQPQVQIQPAPVPRAAVVEKNVLPIPQRRSSQFHIRPVSRKDP